MPNVTMFERFSSIREPKVVKIESVLDGIKNGRWKDKVESIRTTTDNEELRTLKMGLPCVCYAGEFTIPVEITKDGRTHFSCRTDQSLSKHSGIVPIDIDNIDNVDDIFEKLKEDQFIYALWRSSSGRGIHGLIRIGDGNKHRHHYQALIQKYHFLDTTARNESRILFVSYDPDIYVNPKSSIFYDIAYEEEDIDKERKISFGDGYTDYKKIDIACKMVRLSYDGEKHNTLLKASVLLGGYVASGRVEKNIAEELLWHEISKRNIQDPISARDTIKDGILFGMTKPLDETEANFQSAATEVAMHEGSLDFLSVNAEDEDYIRRFKDGLIPLGLPLGHEELDEYLLLKEGEFYGVLAHSNIGKTSLTLWLIFLSAIRYNWNWLIYTGENKSSGVKMKLIEFYCGRKIKTIPNHWLKEALKWVNDHFFIVKTDRTYEYKELVNFAETLSRYKSLKGVFIDPYNSLKAETSATKSKYQYDYEAYSDMLAFTSRTKTTLILSVHTNTESQRLRDKDGNPVMPFASMAEGGVALLNKVDNFIVYNRKTKDPSEWMFTEVSVDKVRNQETGGKPTKRNEPVRLKMEGAVEFTDEQGIKPLTRDYLPTYE